METRKIYNEIIVPFGKDATKFIDRADDHF
jgi:hypothetical protein